MKKHFNLIVLLLLINSNFSFSQSGTIPYDWGWTRGKLTRSTKIVDENRVLDGPFSYTGTENSPSTLTVKGNYKSGVLHGPFSLNWLCSDTKEGFQFTASGSFLNDSLDGVWNFLAKGRKEGKPFHRKFLLTFKHGWLMKGKIEDILNKSTRTFACDEFGFLHGNITWVGYENGFKVEILEKYIHGVYVLDSKKDVASGSYLKKPELQSDTSIVNERNFNSKMMVFKKGGDTYNLLEGDAYFGYLFTDFTYLGCFEESSSAVGMAPFIVPSRIVLPSDAGIEKAEANEK